MKNLIIFFLVIITIGIIGILNRKDKKMTLKVGYSSGWNDLIPTLQHTSNADSLLHNQFEPLVVLDKNGVNRPMAAKSWLISEDKRVFTFDIDTSRRFSNGISLSAKHFKESWEYSLTVTPKSANNSLLDVLYKIEGFNDYKQKGEISGIEVVDEKTLRITFKDSFRIALNYLTGTRMAAFIKDGEKFLGTGPYVINELSKEELLLIKNRYFKDSIPFDKVSVKVIPSSDSNIALESGEIDIYTSAKGPFDICSNEHIECVSGFEDRHAVIVVNGQKGRLLSNPNYRKALQYLFLDEFTIENIPKKDHTGIQVDPQIFLPLQAGRIEESKVKEIINEGKLYVDEFIQATQNQPLYFSLSSRGMWLGERLKKKGVKFSEEAKPDYDKYFFTMYHKTYEPDLISRALSVFNGDPDGIYHALGQNGAISSPMIRRKEVEKFLEEGRKIIDFNKLAPHYQKVTEATLREVPFIHVGFLKDIIVLRKDRVKLNEKYINREDGRFINYRPVSK